MGKVLNFQQKSPLYCAQDLREYIGYIIEDVILDEYDCNAKLVLRDKGSKSTGWRNSVCAGTAIKNGLGKWESSNLPNLNLAVSEWIVTVMVNTDRHRGFDSEKIEFVVH